MTRLAAAMPQVLSGLNLRPESPEPCDAVSLTQGQGCHADDKPVGRDDLMKTVTLGATEIEVTMLASRREDVVYDQLIRALGTAARMACERMPSAQLTALCESVDVACRLSADVGWDRKAAAHASFFNVLAEAAGDPVVAPVLVSGGRLAYDLMITVGRAANGITINSRRRFLDCLHAGDAQGAAAELEDHLRILHFMYRPVWRTTRRVALP